MGQEQGTGGTAITGSRDPAELRSEIEETREALGETVEALAAKTDVKAQLSEKVRVAKENPRALAVVAAVAVALLARRVLRRR
jgi:Protein of unknown function (DUF3618)